MTNENIFLKNSSSLLFTKLDIPRAYKISSFSMVMKIIFQDFLVSRKRKFSCYIDVFGGFL